MVCELYFAEEKLKISETNETIISARFHCTKTVECSVIQGLQLALVSKMTPVMPSERNGQMAREQIDQ